MHEAFETNNWYNDISTRDRSREGAEEAKTCFKNPNIHLAGCKTLASVSALKKGGPGAPALGFALCGPGPPQ